MEAGFERIVWNDSLVTGVAEIDQQHRILVNMLNDAGDMLSERSGRELLEGIVRDLISYAIYHFDTEEEMMVQSGYDEERRVRHFSEHRAFSDKVAAVQMSLAQGTLISRDELLGFLNGWLINHIMNTDKQLGAFLASK